MMGRGEPCPLQKEGWVVVDTMTDRRTRIIRELRVQPGSGANIAGRDRGWTGGPESEQARAANAEARRQLLAEPDETDLP
jgi:hypothetical protein